MFKSIYLWTLSLARHQFATYWLAFIGFIESIFFPIPADILLAPMCLANRQEAYRYALILSIFSVVGGIIGYFIGYLFSDFALNAIAYFGKEASFAKFQSFFQTWGLPFVIIASITPIPYKVAAISSGLIPINFFIFFIGSVLFRPLRFFIIAWAIKKGGAELEKKLLKYIEIIGWVCVIVISFMLIHLFIIK